MLYARVPKTKPAKTAPGFLEVVFQMTEYGHQHKEEAFLPSSLTPKGTKPLKNASALK